MRTYQDLLEVGQIEQDRIEFIRAAVADEVGSGRYRLAKAAEEYYAKRNPTITKYQKILRDISGAAVVDVFGADYRLKTLAFRRLVTQQVQFVLSNGVSFVKSDKQDTKGMLGESFDRRLAELASKAMVDGVSFGFWNYDHLEVFGYAQTDVSPGFVPLQDEETGDLMAGIRFWSVADHETNRMTLYEPDGYTEYIQRKKDSAFEVMAEKQPYIRQTQKSAALGVIAQSGRNWARLPIIAMYANDIRTSEIEGIRETIDCIDFVKSGLANNIDDMSGFYWVLKNTGGMDDVDLRRFLERMKVVKAASVEDGTEATPHTIDVPFEARDSLLNRLEADLYKDFQIINVSELSAAAKTATEIRAAYQPMEDKCGAFEYCIRDFIAQLLSLIGVEDEPRFTWNRIANMTEETQMIMTAAMYLDEKTILNKLPWLTPEEVDDILARKDERDFKRLTGGGLVG